MVNQLDELKVPTKILIIGMMDSVHTYRWLEQFIDSNLEFELIPSTPNRRIHPGIREILKKQSTSSLYISKLSQFGSVPIGLLDLISGFRIRGRIVAHRIRKFRPDFVHLLETQHAGYIGMRAFSRMHKKPKIILTIWGSDLNWFKDNPKHEKLIRETLLNVDYLSCECKRDQEIAMEMGYKNRFLQIIPASGGVELPEDLDGTTKASLRKKIMVKGYSGFVGKAQSALESIERCADFLQDYEIHVYSSGYKTRWACKKILARTNLSIICHPKKSLSFSEMLKLYGESRLSISASLSDGFPGSLREAMMMGCFPIESCGSCSSEWITPGDGGLIINPNDAADIDQKLQMALLNDDLVDNATFDNRIKARQMFERNNISNIARSFYS